ncbi:MAG: hypothetical protein KH152_10640 [Finegoldia magna]|nr:hypothetical protein [Finegoldia magna]
MASFPFFYLANFANARFKRAIPSSISCSGIIRDGVKRTTFGPAIKASKQAPEVFFREAMTNSYSLEKLVYLVKSIKSGKCVYSVADMSGSRVFALIEMINDEMETFTNGAVFDLMNEAKKACEIKLDAGYTQANQLINLCERLGLVEKIKGMGAAKNGSQQYRFIKNDFYNYLADAFKA